MPQLQQQQPFLAQRERFELVQLVQQFELELKLKLKLQLELQFQLQLGERSGLGLNYR